MKDATAKITGFASEFKAFISKGNVIDMAIGVIIGGAFGKIVSSLVADVIMPAVGVLTGNINFSDLKWVIIEEVKNIQTTATGAIETTIVSPEVAITYGKFVQFAIDFLIIAFALFVVIKIMANFKRKEEAKPAEPPPPTQSEVLLKEIRDLLKERSKS